MSATKRLFKCHNDPQKFCYACGNYIFTTPVKFTAALQTAYRHYFQIEPENLGEPWIPSVVCSTCKTYLAKWMSGASRYLSFDVPTKWSQPFCHVTDCYFCLTKVQQQGRHKKVTYPQVPSMTKPIPHSPDVPYPVCPKRKTELEEVDDQFVEFSESADEEEECERNPKLYTQSELNDLVRDLDLSKQKSEMLASRLKERNLLSPDVKITSFRNRHKKFDKYYARKDDACFCFDIKGLFKEFGEPYDPAEWRLFIDSSKLSLKAVLLHQGNNKPSIPLAHAVNMKETYDSMALLLDLIKYDEHNWKICSDLKVVAMLTGLQQGYTKYMCFLCKWDSRARKEHYIRKEWPKRTNFIIGKENVKCNPLIAMEKIILPPLHIKLGLFKNFVKALNKEGQAFTYLKSVFPNLSDAKIKEGVFVGPQIKKLLQDQSFNCVLTQDEAKAWKSFQNVVSSFLGNVRSPDYKCFIDDLLKNYQKIGFPHQLGGMAGHLHMANDWRQLNGRTAAGFPSSHFFHHHAATNPAHFAPHMLAAIDRIEQQHQQQQQQQQHLQHQHRQHPTASASAAATTMGMLSAVAAAASTSTVGIFNNGVGGGGGGNNNGGGSTINSPRISDSNDVHNPPTNCNPHSTTSPKTSPNPSNEAYRRLSSNTEDAKLTAGEAEYDRDELDDDNDQISVTGSDLGSNGPTENERRSPLIGGAFTSLIHKNHAKMKSGLELLQNGAFSSGPYPPQIQQPHPLNHALAAQLFFQNPLIPQPNHWLYNQLYGNYQELPWFRQSLFANNNNTTPNNDSKDSLDSPKSSDANCGNKRSITVVSSNGDEDEEGPPCRKTAATVDDNDEDRRKNSPSVTSTKRSPSPEVLLPGSPGEDSVSSVTVLEQSTKIRRRSSASEKLSHREQQQQQQHNKQGDVWRPY